MKPRLKLRICIDVAELQAGLDFYTRAFGLTVGRRHGDVFAQVLGASAPIDLLARAAGTQPSPNEGVVRDYRRHWTPVHLDFVVEALDAAVAKALRCGATLDQPVQVREVGADGKPGGPLRKRLLPARVPGERVRRRPLRDARKPQAEECCVNAATPLVTGGTAQ